ncbi:unnamed protein product [Darwinula stevensoni]|uniref:Uncharacterized protein n=1 Tax=Darwinula stevensoni TaxID=69355 RepID=A0A7R8X3T5_9CRUS|nr:unnamed protein product [Darwinula stevensoni]CAG0882878.1 unnamed protein product [Darwinula stevensoni]
MEPEIVEELRKRKNKAAGDVEGSNEDEDQNVKPVRPTPRPRSTNAISISTQLDSLMINGTEAKEGTGKECVHTIHFRPGSSDLNQPQSPSKPVPERTERSPKGILDGTGVIPLAEKNHQGSVSVLNGTRVVDESDEEETETVEVSIQIHSPPPEEEEETSGCATEEEEPCPCPSSGNTPSPVSLVDSGHADEQEEEEEDDDDDDDDDELQTYDVTSVEDDKEIHNEIQLLQARTKEIFTQTEVSEPLVVETSRSFRSLKNEIEAQIEKASREAKATRPHHNQQARSDLHQFVLNGIRGKEILVNHNVVIEEFGPPSSLSTLTDDGHHDPLPEPNSTDTGDFQLSEAVESDMPKPHTVRNVLKIFERFFKRHRIQQETLRLGSVKSNPNSKILRGTPHRPNRILSQGQGSRQNPPQRQGTREGDERENWERGSHLPNRRAKRDETIDAEMDGEGTLQPLRCRRVSEEVLAKIREQGTTMTFSPGGKTIHRVRDLLHSFDSVSRSRAQKTLSSSSPRQQELK